MQRMKTNRPGSLRRWIAVSKTHGWTDHRTPSPKCFILSRPKTCLWITRWAVFECITCTPCFSLCNLGVVQICGLENGVRMDACLSRALSRCTMLQKDDQNSSKLSKSWLLVGVLWTGSQFVALASNVAALKARNASPLCADWPD